MQATEDLLYYGLPITTDTVRLHHEFTPTSCPHRSLSLHGGTTESVKEYFVIRMNEFAELGSTVEEMLAAIARKRADRLDSNKENFESNDNQMIEKTNDEIAEEVIVGIWGNGEERKQLLEEAGYDYDAIQEIVNEKLS